MTTLERNGFLQRLETRDAEEVRILFDILDSYACSVECYMRGSELDGCDDDGLYYGTYTDGELTFEAFTGVWDEDGDTGQYVIDDTYLPAIVKAFEAKTDR